MKVVKTDSGAIFPFPGPSKQDLANMFLKINKHPLVAHPVVMREDTEISNKTNLKVETQTSLAMNIWKYKIF